MHPEKRPRVHRKVDPAALLFAVLAVGINPLTTPGLWDKMNTIVAAVVGMVLFAFTWPRRANLQDESGQIIQVDKWVTAAQAVVYGLVITIGSAWPIQSLLVHVDCPDRCDADNRIAARASYWAVVIGGVFAITLFLCMRRTIKRLIRRPPPPPPLQPTSNALVLLWVVIVFLLSRRSSPMKRSSRQRPAETKRIGDRK